MEWQLFAHLREVAGGATVSVDVGDDATVETALEALLATRPELAEEVLDDDGDLAPHIHVLVDGEDPFADGDGLRTAVGPETDLALFPPVSGG
ncbi:ubiquitin-like small modifier protein 1 [Halomicroarcula sp. GCM10025324]|uniref:ubiquitin-like small modifier protein 1 n=1 Tax=Haloarcula TaxID=2237 RepID=UPI0023E8A1E7|nr:ubiquitin-like small modifier protein 1 [Halomicroarcula sp. ZS-22-S1]